MNTAEIKQIIGQLKYRMPQAPVSELGEALVIGDLRFVCIARESDDDDGELKLIYLVSDGTDEQHWCVEGAISSYGSDECPPTIWWHAAYQVSVKQVQKTEWERL